MQWLIHNLTLDKTKLMLLIIICEVCIQAYVIYRYVNIYSFLSIYILDLILDTTLCYWNVTLAYSMCILYTKTFNRSVIYKI